MHNTRIGRLFDRAKKRAWAKVKQDPRAQALIEEDRSRAIREVKARNESIQISLAEMNYYRKNGMSDVEPRSFPHYKRIAKLFDRAKKRAWAQIKRENDVQKLLLEERDQKLKNRKANKGTIEKIIKMPK